MTSISTTVEAVGLTRLELLTASDEEIQQMIQFTDPMVLRGLIYQLTGDESIAATKVAKARFFFAQAYAPASAEDTELIQVKAVEFLKRYRDQGAGAIDIGPPERLARSLALACGEEIAPGELAMWTEEAAINPWARAANWPSLPTAQQIDNFSVIVVGAGMGGLGAAVQLKQAGIPYTVIEKNSGVGGTWFENRYPGARVDTPSRAYTHIFGADFIFSHPFAPQSENERYFNWVADHHELRPQIRFNTEINSMVWDEVAKLWTVKATGPKGVQTLQANAIICASGLLARPNLPTLPGMDSFKGRAFHTARWPTDLDLAGKRVAVVGTGATGYQMVPELADLAEHVYLFQRKPQWVFELPGYRHPLPPQVNWLDRNLPFHINFMRFRTNWLTGEHVYSPIFSIDPEWSDPHTRSALNKEVRDGRIAYIKEKFASRPEMIDSMIPPHPPFSARPLLVDADYNIYDALLRDDVSLVSGGIERITERGVVSGGQEYEVDVIVYATGFKANELLWPMEVQGIGGQSVEELWAHDGARAYISGSMLPGFPNLFMLYGPNTNPAAGGGIVNHEEMVTRFAIECMQHLIVEGKRQVNVSLEGYWRYNRLLDEREAGKTYTDHRAQNFFMNKFSRSSVMCPFAPSELWTWLHHPDRNELIVD
jgi:4-hydroxyacetophenone monooxygenase